jgi:hypothetical protein
MTDLLPRLSLFEFFSEGKMYENDILDVLPWNLQREIMNHNQQPLFDQVHNYLISNLSCVEGSCENIFTYFKRRERWCSLIPTHSPFVVPALAKVPVLNDETFTPRALLARLAPVLSSELIFSSEVIFEEDMTGTEMYFISSGIVQIFSKFYEPMIKVS